VPRGARALGGRTAGPGASLRVVTHAIKEREAMLVLVGIAFGMACVIGGFIWEGGKPLALFIPAEYVIIAGAAIGSLVAMSPPRVLKRLGKVMGTMLKGDRYSKQKYLDMLTMLYEFFQVAKKDGLVGLEAHVEDPQQSSIFGKYPSFLQDHHAVSFLCDTVKIIITAGVPAHDLESLMDADIETRHHEEQQPIGVLTKIGDALPGLGIVAAVLGIVITMAHIDGPPEEIGHKVAAALVGTFLGLLLSYGMIQPMYTNMELLGQSESRYFQVMKTALVAFWKHMPALVAVEFARRTIETDIRPTFRELEEACRPSKG
jgi:chemotaxis protein MotA